jgi:hypothetical protein
MSESTEEPELAEVVLQLRSLLAWLDANGHSHAAIDLNGALEKLAPSGLTVDQLVPSD